MVLSRRRVADARDMAALAHPLRLDLLELLLVHGAMTASEAGRKLGESASNVSWHLRKLAEHGFVRQSATGPGRRRPWRIIAESLTENDDVEDSASSAALRDVALERELQLLRAALARHPQNAEEWKEATSVTSGRLWLTAAEARELGERIAALVEPYTDRLAGPGSRPVDARLVAMTSWVVLAPDPT